MKREMNHRAPMLAGSLLREADAPLPPLPPTLPDPQPRVEPPGPILPLRFRALRPGAYLLRFTPSPQAALPQRLMHYDGTMRVERVGRSATTASGDLYVHRPWLAPAAAALAREPNPADGIPIFPIGRYAAYVRVTQILEGATLANSFTLGFELHGLDPATKTWNETGTYSAAMAWGPAPAGFQDPGEFLSGDVKDASGVLVGKLTMGWVSPFLRKATLEIDRQAACDAPADNAAGAGWKEHFEALGWELSVVLSDADIQEPPPTRDDSWTEAELHAALLQFRDRSDLDAEWRYCLLCVSHLAMTERGIMFDAYGADSNKVPREGAAIASEWPVPDRPEYGSARARPFGHATSAYYRTAVHEIGHAFGLYHNSASRGFMITTPELVALGGFPGNIQWSFEAQDAFRLRHLPDIYVRPGGIPFGAPYSSVPISPPDLERVEPQGLVLRVAPLLEAVPIGAPVRVSFELENEGVAGAQPVLVPSSLRMKSGAVQGRVIDPSGLVGTFRPVVVEADELGLEPLAPGQRRSHALTLLRGAEGPLFSQPGLHEIVVELCWTAEGVPMAVRGSTTVIVTPAVDDAHARAARRILSTPDALLVLAIGGDHLEEGMAAIEEGLQNPVLRPHYAFIEAKRVGRRFGKRPADLGKAAALLSDGRPVVSAAERRHADAMLDGARRTADEPSVRRFEDVIQHLAVVEPLAQPFAQKRVPTA